MELVGFSLGARGGWAASVGDLCSEILHRDLLLLSLYGAPFSRPKPLLQLP